MSAQSDPPVAVTDRKASLYTRLTVLISGKHWRNRADLWAQDGAVGLERVVEAVLEECRGATAEVAVDLGCGSGQVTFGLARMCRQVLAVDIDPEAIDMLRTGAEQKGITNLEAIVRPLEMLELDAASVDLIVSNYALHHLRDSDKRQLLEHCYMWLTPGGRLVIGDMMFGRGGTSQDRVIIQRKVAQLLKRGPGGWWRILKNAVRFLARFQEKPLRRDVWQSMILAAGFTDVHSRPVVAEAHVISATKPR